ncbi:MAG: S-methyl-5'-thioadenosine phosphorylase [FCB group bacterium]|nr:S-methyl-5'-thioadenosine phosphorylase [FCB group bacterium]
MIGIIGGTGIYRMEGLELIEKRAVSTPFGDPSAPLLRGRLGKQEVVFLPRHGNQHQFLPSEVNYRANIYALKMVGVTKIIGISAVGSLRREIAPGDLSVPDQYFDWTRGQREGSFFGKGLVAHISTAKPVCPALTSAISRAGQALELTVHVNKSYACVEGPRLGTQAESFFLRDSAGCDLVGMTNIPEAFLAREAQICYATITIATDYDCWLDDPEQHVSVAKVLELYGKSLHKVNSLLKYLLNNPFPEVECQCRASLKEALLTPEDALTDDQKTLLTVLRK